jgi:hypothetical protein
MIHEFSGTTHTLKLYINSGLDKQTSSTNPLYPINFQNSNTLSMGGQVLGGNLLFPNIQISNAQIYNKALSQTEILQNYYQAPIVTDGLVFAVDANNLVSYPKSGTSLYNLTSSISTVVGSLINGPTYGIENGGSIVFDGVDDYIDFTNLAGTLISNPSLNNGIISFSCWVFVSNPGSYYIISSGGQTSSTGVAFSYQNGAPFVNVRGTNFIAESGISILDFPLNTWINFTFVANGSNLTLYKNGVYLNQRTFQLDSRSDTQTILSLGRPNNFAGLTLGGKLSQVLFYSKALTASEVAQNYNATKDKFQGQQIVTNGLVLNLDSANKDSYPGTGTTWNDLSGNNNNGTLINGVVWNPILNGGSMVFDGVDDLINCGVTNNIFTNDTFATIECWFKSSDNGAGTVDNGCIIGTRVGKNMMLCKGTNGIAKYLYDTTTDGNQTILGTTDVFDQEWHYIVGVFNNGATIIYIDGVSEGTGTSTAPLDISTSHDFGVGGDPQNVNRQVYGQVAIGRVYSKALTSEEVQQNFNAQKTRFGL